ncbi:MAG TPA: hypothetical protein VK737_11810 [Opitutales bacterium]|nr:hypothetical protein [Opitutales bacterium]
MLRLLRFVQFRHLSLLLIAALVSPLSVQAQSSLATVDHGLSSPGDFSKAGDTFRAAFPARGIILPTTLVPSPFDSAIVDGTGIKFLAHGYDSTLSAELTTVANDTANDGLLAADTDSNQLLVPSSTATTDATPTNAPSATELSNPSEIDFAPQIGYFDDVDTSAARTVNYDPAISTMRFHSILVSDPNTARMIKRIRTTMMPMLFVASCFSLFYVSRRMNERRKLSLLSTLNLSDRFFDQ